jgi:hypothetical protein
MAILLHAGHIYDNEDPTRTAISVITSLVLFGCLGTIGFLLSGGLKHPKFTRYMLAIQLLNLPQLVLTLCKYGSLT